MGILGNIFGKPSGHSETPQSSGEAPNVTPSTVADISTSAESRVQRSPESNQHLPTVTMPENSDSLELQTIGRAASGAQRILDGVKQRHPTTPPLSAKGGNMLTMAGDRSKGRPMSRMGSALRQAGQRIIRRAPLGNMSSVTTPGDYSRDKASPVWLEKSSVADTTSGDSGVKPPPSGRQVIRRKASTRPKAVVQKKALPAGRTSEVAPSSASSPANPKRPMGRVAATVIRRRPSVEAMPRIKRGSEKHIRPTIERSMTASRVIPMASPDRWKPQEMGASEVSKAGPVSMESMLDAPANESRSLNLKPVAQRKPDRPSVDHGQDVAEHASSHEQNPATAPATAPTHKAATAEPVAKAAKKSILSRGRDIVFRKSQDRPAPTNGSIDRTPTPKAVRPAVTTGQRKAEPKISQRPAPKTSVASPVQRLTPERKPVATRTRAARPGTPVTQEAQQTISKDVPSSVSTPKATPGPTQVQRVAEVSSVAISNPVIDVPSRVIASEVPTTTSPIIEPAFAEAPKAQASLSTQVHPAKRMLNNARELVFRKSAPSSNADHSKGVTVTPQVAGTAPAASQPAHAAAKPSPVQRTQSEVSPATTPLTENAKVDTRSAPSKPAKLGAPTTAAVSKIVRRSADAVSRVPRMVLRKESKESYDSPHATAMTRTRSNVSSATQTSTSSNATSAPQTAPASGKTTAPRKVARKIRRSLGKATNPVMRVSTKVKGKRPDPTPVARRSSARVTHASPGPAVTAVQNAPATEGGAGKVRGPNIQRSGSLMTLARKLTLRKSPAAPAYGEATPGAGVAVGVPAETQRASAVSKASHTQASAPATSVRRKTDGGASAVSKVFRSQAGAPAKQVREKTGGETSAVSKVTRSQASAPATSVRRKTDGGTSASAKAPEEATPIRRQQRSSFPAAEPMAHVNIKTAARPDVQRLPDKTPVATQSQGPKTVREHGPAPQRNTRPTKSSPIRRATERVTAKVNEPSAKGTSATSVQRGMDVPALTHSRRPVPNMHPVNMTIPGANKVNSTSAMEPVANATPRHTLRGVDRSASNLASATPRSERPVLGVAKPIVHRLSTSIPAQNAKAATNGAGAMNGLANGINISNNGSTPRKAQSDIAANSGSNGSKAPHVQGVVQRVLSPATEFSMNPLIGGAGETDNGGNDSAISRLSPDNKFTGEDIDYLSSKVYTYIKRKLKVERDRSGNPGFALWR